MAGRVYTVESAGEPAELHWGLDNPLPLEHGALLSTSHNR